VSRECEQDRVEADGEANYSKYCPEMIVVPKAQAKSSRRKR
jgi:hypothetical protein